MRTAILILSFVPFLYYGGKDTMFHFRGRKVSATEHLLHLVLGIVLAVMFSHAVMAHHGIVLVTMLLFVVIGGLDEYVFHRGIPGEESDLHAKEHLALLSFIIISVATDWLEKNHWNVSPVIDRIRTLAALSV
jgi:hypothetical protein